MIRIINEGSSQLVNELVDTSPCESVEDVFQHSLERNRVLKAGEYIESWEASTAASVISSGNLFYSSFVVVYPLQRAGEVHGVPIFEARYQDR